MIAQRQPEDVPIIPARRGDLTMLCTHAFLAILVGLASRLLFVFRFPASAGDSETYIQLARNWVDHQVYGLWSNGHLVPTDLRVPGYPAFLAGVAVVFGRSTRAIVLSQAALDLSTCFLAAALGAVLSPVAARRRVAIATLWLAATCPFLANYSTTVLTEVLATFLTTAALLSFAAALNQRIDRPKPFSLVLAGAFVTGIATLVRPETPLLLVAAIIVFAWRWRKLLNFRKMVLVGVAMTGAFLVPLTPWVARNLITLHEFQIIAPRYATMKGEYAPTGYYAWTGTWLERYRDVYLNIWKIGEEQVDMEDLPDEAFDSSQEKARVARLLERYNNSEDMDISPEMDREFAEIARERTRRHPLRTYLRVPFQRALTIWFTPRTELLPIDGKLWPLPERWRDSHANVLITAGFAILGYAYIALALGGIWVVWRGARSGNDWVMRNTPNFWGIALVLTYILMRTVFLTTVETPEPRYVLPCYPAVLALATLLRVGDANQG